MIDEFSDASGGTDQLMLSVTQTTDGTSTLKIGANAFYGDKKLTKINVVTTKLKSSNVGKNIFKGTSNKLTISVPKKQKNSYTKIFKTKGNKSIIVNPFSLS